MSTECTNFYLIVRNHPLKKTKISEEKLEGQRKYEKENRKPTFLPRWEKEFTWLKNMEKGMVCVICNTQWIIYYRSIDFMIRKLDCSVYIITTEQKNYLN